MKLIIVLLTLVSVSAFAKTYSDAGCGLGTLVVGKDGNQILAATTNGTSGNQTFGITSGTSNCTDDGAVAENKRIPMYIEVNKLTLAKEASRGQGEAIAGLAGLYGCNGKTFGTALKQNYKPVFEETSMNAAQIQQKIDAMVSSRRAEVCGG